MMQTFIKINLAMDMILITNLANTYCGLIGIPAFFNLPWFVSALVISRSKSSLENLSLSAIIAQDLCSCRQRQLCHNLTYKAGFFTID
ncbi:hypothetical protein BpHYR1_013991 [Brachionus plicatilis]|uniref:Uncharacterized protein n=1 Tax=Brachionus plicatilis TaxID=10195 RepID=A0A3M7SSL1_BRAPC|nr:hypothetical protein BpHYR1_013991 [Brachionus plicatilis]